MVAHSCPGRFARCCLVRCRQPDIFGHHGHMLVRFVVLALGEILLAMRSEHDQLPFRYFSPTKSLGLLVIHLTGDGSIVLPALSLRLDPAGLYWRVADFWPLRPISVPSLVGGCWDLGFSGFERARLGLCCVVCQSGSLAWSQKCALWTYPTGGPLPFPWPRPFSWRRCAVGTFGGSQHTWGTWSVPG